MRRRMCALMMSLLLLTGCGGKGTGGHSADELALNIRTEYMAMKAFRASVDMIADYGKRVYEYTLDVSWEQDGETVLTVVKPEIIAGITARIQNGASFLDYDGVSLETGVLSADGFSPMEAIPALINYAVAGYIAQSGFEDTQEGHRLLWISCRVPENSPGTGTEAELWFDAMNHNLVRGEILYDGYTVIQCVFTEFTKE